MPLRKLRSLEEAERSLAVEPGTTRLWATVAELWALSARLAPPRFPAGVYRHRAIEDANRLTEAWVDEAIRARRRG